MMLTHHQLKSVFVAAVLCVLSTTAVAGTNVGTWTSLFSGIDHTTGYADGQGGDPLQKVNCLRIDLNADVEFYATPHSGSDETMTQKTGDFLVSNNLQVAINAHFFSPFDSWKSYSYPTGLSGAEISQGNIVSSSHSSYEELLIAQDNTAWFDASPSNSFTDVWTAVAGNTMLLVDGVAQHSAGGDAHPRTAVGISEDDRYLYMMTIDGRQSGVSEGADYKETGDWLVRFGAYDGLNLDGGGSSTMAMDNGADGYDLLNVPSGSERWVGSSIGVRVVPEPATMSLLALGGVALIRRSR